MIAYWVPIIIIIFHRAAGACGPRAITHTVICVRARANAFKMHLGHITSYIIEFGNNDLGDALCAVNSSVCTTHKLPDYRVSTMYPRNVTT